jgi:ABC-type uncharacterized transport system ATPase subunit
MRADLALALLHELEIRLLDEPTLGLDVLARRRILSFIKDLNRERGLSVLVTSHDMAELEQLAGRIVLLHEGQIAFDGVFADLRQLLTQHRVVTLETTSMQPPKLVGAKLVRTDAGRHEFTYDAAAVKLSDLLEQAGAAKAKFWMSKHIAPRSTRSWRTCTSIGSPDHLTSATRTRFARARAHQSNRRYALSR